MVTKNRIRNHEYIILQKDLINLIKIFKVLSFQQVHRYQSVMHRVDKDAPGKTKDMMRNLASEYHFEIDEEMEMYAETAGDLEERGSLAPFWIYCDFKQARRAGALSDTEIPCTSFVFEMQDTGDVIEVVQIPPDRSEIKMINMTLKQYDKSISDDMIYDTERKGYEMDTETAELRKILPQKQRKRLVILPDKSYAKAVTFKYIHRFCIVEEDGFVNYYRPEMLTRP